MRNYFHFGRIARSRWPHFILNFLFITFVPGSRKNFIFSNPSFTLSQE